MSTLENIKHFKQITLDLDLDTTLKHLNFGNVKFSYIDFLRKANIEHKDISHFFILFLDKEGVDELFSEEGLDKFREFQEKLLSDIFFNYRDDIRWNMYLFIVPNDEVFFKKMPIKRIEKDIDYARKTVLTINELKNHLRKDAFIEKIKSSKEIKTISDPSRDWIEILDKAKLSACLTTDYYEKNLDLFLATSSFQDNKLISYSEDINDIKSPKDIIIPDRVTELDISQINRSCFNKKQKLLPSLVNLLHGSNGTGKTSFLEVIEMAVTNDIRRSKEFKHSGNFNEIKIKVSFNSKEITLSSKKSAMDCKQLEKLWYGVPIGRGKVTLNDNFSKFNFFDADKPYRFALEETNKDEEGNQYYNRFSQLMFGESVLQMQKNWIRYKEGFEERYRNIVKEELELEDNIETKKNRISNIKRFNYNKDILEIYNLMNLVRVKNLNEEQLGDLENFKYILRQINSKDQLFLKLRGKLSLKSSTTLSQLMNIKEELKVKHFDIGERYQYLITSKKESDDILEKLQNQNNKLNKTITSLELDLFEVKESINLYIEVEPVLKYPRLVERRTEVIQRNNHLFNVLDLVTSIHNKYSKLTSLNIDNLVPESEEQIEYFQKTYKDKKNELDKILIQIEENKKNITYVKEVKSNLKAIALEFLNNNPTQNCPVCGISHNNSSELISKINKITFDQENSIYNKLISNKEKTERELFEIKVLLQYEEDKRIQRQEINDCYYDILKSNLFPYEKTDSLERKYNIIYDLLTKIDHIKGLISKNIEELTGIEEKGISNSTIQKSKKLFSSTLYKEFLQNSRQDTNFYEFLSSRLNLVQEEINEKYSVVNRNNQIIYEKKNSVSYFDINEIQKDVVSIEQQIIEYDDIIKMLIVVKETFDISEDQNIIEWIQNLELLERKLIVTIQSIEDEKEITKYTKEIEEYTDKLVNKRTEKEKCFYAIEVLSELRKHETYVEHFINSNLNKIEYFFKAIHSPKEFIKLEFDKSGIIAYREKNEDTAKAYEMSTGQRVSLALAVMFTHYLAAPNAPKFLLLDEPVANMDDLHLLSLLDIIREMALQGTQIFFTTANPEVARLFRRKFSFFGKDFKHFDFQRGNDGITAINEYIYKPFEELPENIQINE